MDTLKLNLTLEFLLGNSSKKITQISHAKQGLIYLCGCHIVFYSPFVDQQVAYIKHRNSNISAIAVSSDENFLAVAQTGKNPSIFIYSIQQTLSIGNNQDQKPLFILKGHKQSIDLIKFSPNGKYLVSVCNSDGTLFVWQNGQSIAKNKLSKPVNVLLFDWNQDLLTIGNGYLKLWKFDYGKIFRKKQGEYWMIQGKLVNLGKNFTLRNYIDSAIFYNQEQPNNEKLILLSQEGFLGTINHSYDKIQQWIDLAMTKTSSVQILQNMALCAGDNAVVKIIDLVSLSLKGKFPKPPPLNKQNITRDQQLEISENQKFPACIGLLMFSNFILTLYENSTIFIWTMEQQVKAYRSMITHRQKINCVSLLEEIHDNICFFASAAQDNTLRIWHFYTKCYENRESIDIAEIIGIKRNAYCKNLTKIIYTDSEHPLIKVKPFMKKYIVCISKRQFLMYSLQTFELILHENFESEYRSVSFKNPDIVLSLQVSEDLLYLGFNNGFLKIYKPSEENLLKLKEIDFGDSILDLQMSGQRKILVQCKNKATIYDFESNSRTMFNGIVQIGSTDKYIFLSEEKKVIYYSTLKNRKASEMSLVHEFDPDEKVKVIACNSSLLAILSTKERLVIANFSSTIIYSEMLNQEITDLAITETGQLIFTGREGNIIIKAIADSKYKKIQEKAKKWFEMNDMSWMDNSVWASKQINSHSNIRNRLSDNSHAKINQSAQTMLGALDRAKSINLTNILGDQSIQCVQVPSVQYQYKNDQNKMSVFNPSNIAKQANQIYANVNGLLKNLPNKSNQQKKINFSGDIEDDFFKSSTSAQQNKKKRIFNQESGHYPRFTNNLVESQMAQIRETVEQSNLINEKKRQSRDSRVLESYPQRSKSSSPTGSRMNNHPEALSYSSEYGQNKQVNVNNSLHLSENLNNKQIIVKKQEQIICTFKEIIEAARDGAENIDHQYLKSLVEQNSEDFRKIYLVLDKIYGQKETMQPSIQKTTQTSIMDKQMAIQEFKKMSSAYLRFLDQKF